MYSLSNLPSASSMMSIKWGHCSLTNSNGRKWEVIFAQESHNLYGPMNNMNKLWKREEEKDSKEEKNLRKN